jgi:Tfp pilus assembly protein PilV
MGKLKQSGVDAFSLPETIVALVIILAVFAIATMVLAGTGRTGLTAQQLNAANVLRQFAEKTQASRLFLTDSASVGDFRVYRVVSTYPGYDSLLDIHYYITDQNQKRLADWQSLVRADE